MELSDFLTTERARIATRRRELTRQLSNTEANVALLEAQLSKQQYAAAGFAARLDELAQEEAALPAVEKPPAPTPKPAPRAVTEAEATELAEAFAEQVRNGNSTPFTVKPPSSGPA